MSIIFCMSVPTLLICSVSSGLCVGRAPKIYFCIGLGNVLNRSGPQIYLCIGLGNVLNRSGPQIYFCIGLRNVLNRSGPQIYFCIGLGNVLNRSGPPIYFCIGLRNVLNRPCSYVVLDKVTFCHTFSLLARWQRKVAKMHVLLCLCTYITISEPKKVFFYEIWYLGILRIFVDWFQFWLKVIQFERTRWRQLLCVTAQIVRVTCQVFIRGKKCSKVAHEYYIHLMPSTHFLQFLQFLWVQTGRDFCAVA